jgi:hypothetical protein
MKKFIILTVAMMFVVCSVLPIQAQGKPSLAEVQQRLDRNQLEMRAINAEYILLQQQLEAKQKRFRELNIAVSADQALLAELQPKQAPSVTAPSAAP